MKKYIKPAILPITYSQDVMTLGASDSEGNGDEFSNYGSFDDNTLIKPSKNRLWDDADDKKFGL